MPDDEKRIASEFVGDIFGIFPRQKQQQSTFVSRVRIRVFPGTAYLKSHSHSL
jgi:hypothetical protein